MNILLTLATPFLGTALGAATVLLARRSVSARLHNALLGFAAGVMVAASVWSLIIPSIELSESFGRMSWMPAAVGIILGMLFLLMLDSLVPHVHPGTDTREGLHSSLGKRQMLLLAVTLHNIPEGMAVGVVFAGLRTGATVITAAGAFALSIGIAIQNFPEGAAVSLPMKSQGVSSKKAFLCGAASGIVEPIFGLLTVLIAGSITHMMPWILAFAAGAMIYVVVEELIPEAQLGEHSHAGTTSVMLGFLLMMMLDVMLG